MKTEIERLENEVEDFRAKKNSLHELNDKNDTELRRLEKERLLLEEKLRNQEASIVQLKQDLTEQKHRSRKMGAIIARSRTEDDPFDDQYFVAQFGALGAKIESLVKRHFERTLKTTKWKNFDAVREPDDRDYFLQAYIATQIAREFFAPGAGIFGFDAALERVQAHFEGQLHDARGKQQGTLGQSDINTLMQFQTLKSPLGEFRQSKSGRSCQVVMGIA